MALLSRQNSIFVLIDVQGKLAHLVHEPERLLESCHSFLQTADIFGRPLVLTEQYPRGLGPTEESLLQRFRTMKGETAYVDKEAFGCCAEQTFEGAVAELLPGVAPSDRHYVLAGIEAHVCVLQTALVLLETGAKVFLPWDCVSGRGERNIHWALERMQQAGAMITNHESVGFELARDKNHPSFKQFSALLKARSTGK